MLKKCRCCCFAWFSALVALGVVAHVARLLTGAELQVGNFAVPMNLSIVVAIGAGTLSIVFCYLGCQSCNCPTGGAKQS